MRIGPKMKSVVKYVTNNPGCSKLEAGSAAWNNWKRARMSYLYGPVNRAIEAGLIYGERKGNRIALYPVEGTLDETAA